MLMDTRPPRGSGDAEPWRNEPDRVAWRDPSTGLQCLILRAPLGALCGYVRVPRGHALHGKPFEHRRACRGVYVHGGLTFSGHLGGRRMKRGHWFGFDCGHFCDFVPGVNAAIESLIRLKPELYRDLEALERFHASKIYRTVDFVRVECTSLAAQLAQRE